VLNRVLERNKIRFILADEVGLGKTIEAGLVIKELKTRGLIKITLVICPTGLVTQWRQEMIDKFDEDFKIVLPSEIDTIKNIIGEEDVYNQFSSIITPMDSIKPLQKRKYWSSEKIKEYNEQRFEAVINGNWDLIIIDEAHRVSGSSSDVARFRLGKALSEASPYLLLLTATPHNGKSEPFLRLVRLLDRDLFPNQEAITKEQVSPFVIRTKKREAIDNNGKLLFKKRNTKIKKLRWTNSSNLQKELYEKF
jgi:SNF2 family DNA or RNA helicase